MSELLMGANTTLGAAGGEVAIAHRDDPSIDVNLTAFLVRADGKVRSDADMVFFNQPSGENACVTYHPPATGGGRVTHRLSFDLARLPAGVEKVVVALTEDRGVGFSAVPELSAEVTGAGQTVRLTSVPTFATEKGIMVAELYVRAGQHKVRAVWQGYSSGLHGLATEHGVDVDEPAPPAPPVQTVKPAAPPPPIPTTKAAAPAPAAEAISFRKVSGNISLKKGDRPVVMEKTGLITASVSWASGTDYDVYALVMTRDGQQVDVATFGAKKVKPLVNYNNGAVRHLGDVQRGTGGAQQTETLEIRLNPDILAVVPVAYSAQSNGSGSFYKYKVSLHLDNGSGTRIGIAAENANNDDAIYTCVPGIIRNVEAGVVIEPLELYSARRSENRPKLELAGGEVRITMDAGPKNNYK